MKITSFEEISLTPINHILNIDRAHNTEEICEQWK